MSVPNAGAAAAWMPCVYAMLAAGWPPGTTDAVAQVAANVTLVETSVTT